MPQFSAIDDPWLPVRRADGSIAEVGLREALVDAHTIEGLADPRPLGPPTQLRLLVALVQRVFAPEDATDWRGLWQAGHFEAAELDTYFDRWRPRFDLFHPETPFLQVGGDFAMGNTNPIAKLAHELDPAGYNTLFSHADGPVLPVTPAEALRVLALALACALGGGVSGNPTWQGATVTRPNFSHAPLATSAVVLFEGKTLFQTLLLNLVPGYVEGDRPVWEQPLTPGYFDRKKADGPLDRLTNLSRMIRLLPEDHEGETIVWRCFYTQGRALSEGASDSMVSYRKDDKLGLSSLKVSESRASWRDLHALLAFSKAEGSEDLRAGVLRFVGHRIQDSDLPARQKYQVRVAGIAADKAKVLLWRSDRVDLPAPFLVNDALVASLAACMAEAAEMATEVGRRTRSLCWHFLAPVKDQMAPDTKDVNALADQLDGRVGYWARLEAHYPKLLEDLAALPDSQPETLAPVADVWARHCAEAARETLSTAQQRLGETPRAWRALAAVSTHFGNFKKKEKK